MTQVTLVRRGVFSGDFVNVTIFSRGGQTVFRKRQSESSRSHACVVASHENVTNGIVYSLCEPSLPERKYRPMKKAFTLIELLVAIAIIAILAAILFPVFAQAREKARQTACLSNVKQLSLGLMQYVQDFDETYPTAVIGGSAAISAVQPSAYTWAWAIHPYLKNEQIFSCPSAIDTPARKSNFGASQDIARSYYPILHFHPPVAVTSGVEGASPSGQIALDEPTAVMNDYDTPTTLPDVTRASETVWLVEAGSILPDGTTSQVMAFHGVSVTQRDRYISGGDQLSRLSRRHSGGMNWAFADGHAKWYRPDSTVSLNDASRDLWIANKP